MDLPATDCLLSPVCLWLGPEKLRVFPAADRTPVRVRLVAARLMAALGLAVTRTVLRAEAVWDANVLTDLLAPAVWLTEAPLLVFTGVCRGAALAAICPAFSALLTTAPAADEAPPLPERLLTALRFCKARLL